ncbi:DUF2059 domain-containing protein [Lacibacterium aquatile]|uniref:DUF2059 domain-containing protein n=1 Tax=Lacibacterium aquatile TaxID=1168082 RepID=A0ABW5DUK7_9PROT
MRRSALIPLLLTCVLLQSGAAVAQSTEANRLAGEILDKSGAVQLVRNTMISMSDQMGKLLVATNPDKGPLIQQLMTEEVLPAFLTRLPELVPELSKLYALTYTEEELRFMHAYITSPIGQAIVAKQPNLQTQLQQVGQVWGQKVAMETMQTLAPKFRERGLKL